MKDAGQKDLLYRHFRSRGWFAMVEVPVGARDASSPSEKLIADIDVLALRATPDLTWDIVIGDCKTKKGESPASRALWVRSIMEFMEGSRGFLILRREKGLIEPDHRLVANSQNVTLLDEAEFAAFDRAILYPSGSSKHRWESATNLRDFYSDMKMRFTPLRALLDFMSGGAWMETDHLVVLRKMLGLMLDARNEIDPEKREHVGIVLEATAIFAVALATCVGRAFHQFGLNADRDTMDDGLNVMLWGGRERYRIAVSMKQRLFEAQGMKPTLDDLRVTLPEWPQFLQLVRSGMEAPRLAFRVPTVLRALAMEQAGFMEPSPRSINPMTLKLSLLTVTYFAKACRLPKDLQVLQLLTRDLSTSPLPFTRLDRSEGQDVEQLSLGLTSPQDDE